MAHLRGVLCVCLLAALALSAHAATPDELVAQKIQEAAAAHAEVKQNVEASAMDLSQLGNNLQKMTEQLRQHEAHEAVQSVGVSTSELSHKLAQRRGAALRTAATVADVTENVHAVKSQISSIAADLDTLHAAHEQAVSAASAKLHGEAAARLKLKELLDQEENAVAATQARIASQQAKERQMAEELEREKQLTDTTVSRAMQMADEEHAKFTAEGHDQDTKARAKHE